MHYGGTLNISAENLLIDENFVRMNPDAKVGSYIVVSVCDTGIGISPEIIDRIFEPFFTTARNRGGTGLGLNIVYNLITQKLAGQIDVQSDVGSGTTFTVAIPNVTTDLHSW